MTVITWFFETCLIVLVVKSLIVSLVNNVMGDVTLLLTLLLIEEMTIIARILILIAPAHEKVTAAASIAA